MSASEHGGRTVVVVGAGAAGFLAAISAARHGARVLLLDRRRKVGAKILISGGTRCNVTNAEVRESDFNTPSPPFVRNVLREFPPDRARAFFEDCGVALKLEPTGKYFPTSDSARDVLAGLLRAAEAAGVDLRREVLVTAARYEHDRFRLDTDAGPVDAAAVVLCTGGLSYPETGSDGVGYNLARGFGHSIVRTSPALTPLLADPAPHAELAGVALPARLVVRAGGRATATREGALLFTHTGYSGPVALDVSRHWIRRGWDAPSVELRASFVPHHSAESLEAAWLDEARRAPRRKVANLLSDIVPNRLAAFLVASAAHDADLTLGAATRETRRRILAVTLDCALPVTGVAGYRKAEVTAGGVALSEVVARTLESKLRPGLYFAGEILDVDGFIGGFNFQWAWSSGWVAGRAAALNRSP
jgi:predicted Rossmann fold flavoprotein